ncbi:zinc finger CCCH domain-containing protein 53 isoform X2 [Amborella trichopoda]|uniref:zinc finger CCCH domain-containing protein 53 isoform X2 n=1 Tax=Amborella trichopoda TaxID=13333 RepID=UPI0005D3C783|nr:zinc finger CCCH domain-containing protein 53 isoform X2 [Amborella trichopoda]|eukprot:XP_011629245.1 zinc finger CCCH domain-containing protein 53 isoform X2 [Amborella trichopoda]
MDAYEATRIVFSRIQNLDPENAPKIMGLLLIQDHGEKEMIRLAFGPEALVQSIVAKARKELGLGLGLALGLGLGLGSGSRVGNLPNTCSHLGLAPQQQACLPPSTSTSTSMVSSWVDAFPNDEGEDEGVGSDVQKKVDQQILAPNPSYAVSSGGGGGGGGGLVDPESSSGNGGGVGVPLSLYRSSGSGVDMLLDELHLQDQLSFLNDNANANPALYAAAAAADSMTTCDSGLLYSYTNWGAMGLSPLGGHRRSLSVADICWGGAANSSDVALASSTSGLAWKPCLYFARGYCKNGSSCRFLHDGGHGRGGGISPPTSSCEVLVSSDEGEHEHPNQQQQCHPAIPLLLRSKSQRSVSSSQQQLTPLSPSLPFAATAKCMIPPSSLDNYVLGSEAHRVPLADDGNKYLFTRSPRNNNEFGGGGLASPGSRQIYLTFPADSTFREEDVSNYFSIYGPVQDVRIPYQQKRMFGFVTFVYPETVKMILAKGNPHYVCDARVLVKPYKEKGKVADKKPAERGDFSPTGLDSRDSYDLQLGGGGSRFFYDSHEVLRRKLEEQADLQQALELQGRRFMELQLLDVKRRSSSNRISVVNQFDHRATGPASITITPPPKTAEDNSCFSPQPLPLDGGGYFHHQLGAAAAAAAAAALNSPNKDSRGVSEEESSPKEQPIPFQESCATADHNLPDSPFASPTKIGGASIFSNNNSFTATTSSFAPPTTASLDVPPAFNSCFFQFPRFSSGPGAIGM